MSLTKTALGQSLEGLALAALMSVALPAAVLAQDAPRTRGDTPRVEGQANAATTEADTAAPEFEYSIDIPSIEAVDSSMDQETIRAILSGGLVEHAAELAALTAKSISIPEITVQYTIPGEDGQTSVVTYRDVLLSDVANGVAASATINEIEIDAGKEGNFKFGKLATTAFDIGGMLAFYGLVPGAADQPLKTIYADFRMEGGTFTSPEADCTIGAIEGGEFKARPLKYPLSDIMAIAAELEATPDSQPSPEQISQMVNFYADLFSAFQSSPMTFAGLDCTGSTEDGKPITVAAGPINVGGFAKNTYPEIAINDVKVNVEGDGFFNLANLTVKSTDFSPTIAALEEAGGAIDDAWLEANGRRLIPSFAGLAFTGLDMDVADEENPGERIKATVGEFDLTLANYVNGIPADISSHAKGIVAALPTDSEDDTVKQLLALGVDKIEAGYSLAAVWDEASSTVAIKNVSFDGLNLGALALAGTIGNATPDLFATNVDTALGAAMGLTVKNLQVDVTDAGLADILFQKTATEQGQTVEQVRTAMAGVAQGTALALLGATPEAQKLAAALGAFLGGQASSLSVSAVAKAEAGLGLPELMALQANPMTLGTQVTLDATAK